MVFTLALILVIVLILLGVAGWRLWQSEKTKTSESEKLYDEVLLAPCCL